MNLDEVKLTLENESEFYTKYRATKNIETGSEGPNSSGRSVGVLRRSLISMWVRHTCNMRATMLDTIDLEQYFNERWELCPYGLDHKPKKEEKAAMSTRSNDFICLVENDQIFLDWLGRLESFTEARTYVENVFKKRGLKPAGDTTIDKVVNHFINILPEPKTMTTNATNTTPVETITYIFGRPSKDVSDADIFSGIAQLEAEIKRLDAIQNKPKKLVAQIEKLQADIQNLVTIADAR